MTDFTSSALIGHFVSIRVLTLLFTKGLITSQEIRGLADECLLDLESHQALFAENREAFEDAREFLETYARFPEAR